MSFSFQTQEHLYNPKPSMAEDDPLAREFTWLDVVSGLNRVLFGYFLIFLAVCMVIGVAVWLTLTVGLKGKGLEKLTIGDWWFVFAIMGTASLLSLFSWWKVVTGQFRCAINAPDREGAKWMMFATCVCIVIGPVLNIVAGFTDPIPQEDLNKHLEDPIMAAIEQPVGITHMAGFGIDLATTVFFVLFMRAVGICFDNRMLSSMAEFYLVISGILIGVTVYLFISGQAEKAPPMFLLGIGVGWLAIIIWYVVMIFCTKSVIENKMAQLKSPLDLEPDF